MTTVVEKKLMLDPSVNEIVKTIITSAEISVRETTMTLMENVSAVQVQNSIDAFEHFFEEGIVAVAYVKSKKESDYKWVGSPGGARARSVVYKTISALEVADIFDITIGFIKEPYRHLPTIVLFFDKETYACIELMTYRKWHELLDLQVVATATSAASLRYASHSSSDNKQVSAINVRNFTNLFDSSWEIGSSNVSKGACSIAQRDIILNQIIARFAPESPAAAATPFFIKTNVEAWPLTITIDADKKTASIARRLGMLLSLHSDKYTILITRMIRKIKDPVFENKEDKIRFLNKADDPDCPGSLFIFPFVERAVYWGKTEITNVTITNSLITRK